MRFIPTWVHGMLDYTMGALLIASPWLLGFSRGGVETWLPVQLGIGVIAYSAITRYELGLVPVLPMGGHLFLDGASGAILAVSPWLFNFSNITWAPHLILGLMEVAAAVSTQTIPRRVPAGITGRRHAAGA